MQIQSFIAFTKFINRRNKRALLYLALLLCISPAFAQLKHTTLNNKFNKDLADANLSFTLPHNFKEIKPPDNDGLSFDYAIALPDADFEIWFKVRSLKAKNDGDKITNPDSLYLEMGKAQAIAFMGDKNYLTRNIPQYSLDLYNADAGRTYLLNLPDIAATKHYKYAMIVVLQKNHVGTLLAVCFANELGPGFFKNLKQASNCIKFNP